MLRRGWAHGTCRGAFRCERRDLFVGLRAPRGAPFLAGACPRSRLGRGARRTTALELVLQPATPTQNLRGSPLSLCLNDSLQRPADCQRCDLFRHDSPSTPRFISGTPGARRSPQIVKKSVGDRARPQKRTETGSHPARGFHPGTEGDHRSAWQAPIGQIVVLVRVIPGMRGTRAGPLSARKARGLSTIQYSDGDRRG